MVKPNEFADVFLSKNNIYSKITKIAVSIKNKNNNNDNKIYNNDKSNDNNE